MSGIKVKVNEGLRKTLIAFRKYQMVMKKMKLQLNADKRFLP